MAGHLIAAGYRLTVHDRSLALVQELFGALLATGRGDLDHSALALLLGDLAGSLPAV